jgi:hypothetical protein
MTWVIVGGENYATLACNTSMKAFGPLFHGAERARSFVTWLDEDPRAYSNEELSGLKSEWQHNE